jgi:hypothetical protein
MYRSGGNVRSGTNFIRLCCENGEMHASARCLHHQGVAEMSGLRIAAK